VIPDPSQWDEFTMRVVWRFGGYSLGRRGRVRRFPGRVRALFYTLIRSVLRTGTGPLVAPVVTLPISGIRPPVSRAVRIRRAAPFRAVVHCTAPPTRPITSDGRTTP